MYTNRPVIQVKKTLFERLFNMVAIVAFFAWMVYLVVDWASIPERIPSHFNALGEPDGWSSRGFIGVILFIGLIQWIGLSILERYPHVYNYLHLTEENAEWQYKNAIMMINVLKNSIILFFIFISWQSIQVATGAADGLGKEFLFIFLVVILGSSAFFLLRSVRKR
ncbi:DUF1648 domain-containing protein [Jeotgalibacillus marinus]|uniref:DUF1648 domain-containing protein n=1 Tax=Jeotgalibacillus marinus TaxID=86667 RepID=A0ABV3Q5H1_9BACL